MKRERGSTSNRLLDILETVAASDKPVSATEINEVLNLPKATAHRLCSELEARGYLLKKINGKSYMPGNRFHELAVGALSHSRFRALRHAILQSLSNQVGETCNIAYPDQLEMAYSDRVLSPSPLRLHLPIGTRVPLHCTASGKLFLASLTKKKRIGVINKIKLNAWTGKTITDVERLLDEVEQVQKARMAIDNEELYDGVIAIGVPITDRQGRFYSSLAIQAPIFRFPVENALQHEPLLRAAARDLSALIED
jgi:IclR family acetate operon transcriptional repressor